MAERTKQQKEEELAPDKAAREAVKEADPADDTPKFSVERLQAQAGDFFGQPPHVVAGALSSVNRKELTIEEAEAAVKAWLKSPVKEA